MPGQLPQIHASYMASVATERLYLTLNDPELQRKINALRQTDNFKSWFYLVREYLFLAVVIGSTIAFYQWLDANGHSELWVLPVLLVANLCVGAGQHRLVTLTHEAAHYMLFRNRLLNEIVSEWFCMFPVLGQTHSYRVQHLGHHQYPNDPERDPDWAQMRLSGHRFKFPMTTLGFLWHCVIKQFLWPHNLLRYILVRAAFVVNAKDGPYRLKAKRSPLLPIVGAVYFLSLIGVLTYAVLTHHTLLLALVPVVLWAVLMALLSQIPAGHFVQYTIKSDLPVRVQSMMKLTFHTLTVTGLAWLTYVTGKPWYLYYFVLWMVPLGTSFAYFMILRQIVQHGNADQERYTNTRIFHVAWPIGFAVFPIGNDYHLPHHLFPMIPHYNLRKAHQLLMQTEEYRSQAVLVDGYFVPNDTPPRNPTVLDLMTRQI